LPIDQSWKENCISLTETAPSAIGVKLRRLIPIYSSSLLKLSFLLASGLKESDSNERVLYGTWGDSRLSLASLSRVMAKAQ